MLIIGEKINATRQSVRGAIERRDEGAIIELARTQAAAGADYIDVNGGDPRPGAEAENLRWLLGLVQANTDKPVAIDSSDPAAVEAALAVVKGKPIINSISLEARRLEAMLPMLEGRECSVVALCMSDEGTPTGIDDRVDRGKRLVDLLTKAGKKPEEIIVDPCVFPVSSEPSGALAFCRAIARLRAELPGVYVGGGISNISHGLPGRRLINLTMLTSAIFSGMNAAIIDPCLPGVVPAILAAEVLSGADEWCANYIAAHRDGRLG